MGQPGGALEAAVAWRRAPAPAAAGPASQPHRPLGPGLRSPALLAAVETMEGGRAHARPASTPPPLLPPPPPAGLTLSRPLRLGGSLRSWRSPPTRRLRPWRSGNRQAPAAGRLRQRPRLLPEPSTARVTEKVESLRSRRILAWGRGGDGSSGWEEN